MRWRCQGCPRTWDDYANEQDFAEEVWGSAETIPASGVEPYTPRYFHTQSDGGNGAQATCGPVVPDPEPHAYAMNTDHECDTCGSGFAAGQHYGGDYFSRRVPDDALLASARQAPAEPEPAPSGRYRCRGCGAVNMPVMHEENGLITHWLDDEGEDLCGPVVEDPDPDKLEPPTVEEAFGFVRAVLDRCHGREFADRVLDVLRPKIVEALEKPRG